MSSTPQRVHTSTLSDQGQFALAFSFYYLELQKLGAKKPYDAGYIKGFHQIFALAFGGRRFEANCDSAHKSLWWNHWLKGRDELVQLGVLIVAKCAREHAWCSMGEMMPQRILTEKLEGGVIALR